MTVPWPCGIPETMTKREAKPHVSGAGKVSYVLCTGGKGKPEKW